MNRNERAETIQTGLSAISMLTGFGGLALEGAAEAVNHIFIAMQPSPEALALAPDMPGGGKAVIGCVALFAAGAVGLLNRHP